MLLLFALPPGLPGQGTGAVEGTVTLRLKPPRRSTARYPGASTAVREVQKVPAVVFIQGPVAGSPARPPATQPELAQHDTAFTPAAMVIPVGTTVSFPNDDTFFHNVFSYSASARFDLGRYPRGDTKTVTFGEPGIVKVYCEVHEFMRAVIVVVENPFHALVDEEGRFRIEGIPAGTYTLVAWHPDLDPVEEEIRVTAGETARLEAELR